MDDRLYPIVDYILNQAQDQDVEVILKAVSRRYEDRNKKGAMGLKPGQMARETASMVTKQMGLSQDMIRDTVKNLARNTILKNAPELSPEQLDALLEDWVPDPAKQAAARNQKSAAATAKIPRDALITMVRQFMSYSKGSMSASEQVKLENEVPGWTKKYWESFPAELRQIIALNIKGVLSDEEFQDGFSTILKEP